MLASKETNKPVQKSGRSPTTLSSFQQGTPLKYKTNRLIPEKKPQTKRKCNYFLSPTGYPKQTGLFCRKSPKRRGKSFRLYTPERLTLPYGVCRLPMSIPSSNCQALGKPVLLRGILKERAQDKWPRRLLGP